MVSWAVAGRIWVILPATASERYRALSASGGPNSSECEDVATTMRRAALAGLGRLVIELVLIVVGQFLSSLDIPQHHDRDSVAILFVWQLGSHE